MAENNHSELNTSELTPSELHAADQAAGDISAEAAGKKSRKVSGKASGRTAGKKKSSLISSLIINGLLLLMMLSGIGLLVYPTFSDRWNAMHQSRAIAGYTALLSDMEPEDYEKLKSSIRSWNKTLRENQAERFKLVEDEQFMSDYDSLLDVTGTGVIGYIQIPKIKVELPIYHGVEESVLQIAIGHIPWSSLPLGGSGTHTVVSGHRGLPSAKLFTRLDEMARGDIFMLNVLDETLTYRVDQIRTVEPYELDNLSIDAGRDYCTMVTCTPYGINTHRLLVRGHRIDNLVEDEGELIILAEAEKMDILPLAGALTLPIFVALLLIEAMLPAAKKV